MKRIVTNVMFGVAMVLIVLIIFAASLAKTPLFTLLLIGAHK